MFGCETSEPQLMIMCDCSTTDHASAELARGGSRPLTLSFHFEVAVMRRLHRGVIKDNPQRFISADPPVCPHLWHRHAGTEHRQMSDILLAPEVFQEKSPFCGFGLC